MRVDGDWPRSWQQPVILPSAELSLTSGAHPACNRENAIDHREDLEEHGAFLASVDEREAYNAPITHSDDR